MLLLGACLIQTLYSHGQTRATANLVTAITAVGTLAASGLYIRSGNILHHFMAFSTMVTLMWPRTSYLIWYRSRPQQDRRRLLWRCGKAVVLLAVGYLVWNVDLRMCHALRELRARIGLPWAWLLELHGWWYVSHGFLCRTTTKLTMKLQAHIDCYGGGRVYCSCEGPLNHVKERSHLDVDAWRKYLDFCHGARTWKVAWFNSTLALRPGPQTLD